MFQEASWPPVQAGSVSGRAPSWGPGRVAGSGWSRYSGPLVAGAACRAGAGWAAGPRSARERTWLPLVPPGTGGPMWSGRRGGGVWAASAARTAERSTAPLSRPARSWAPASWGWASWAGASAYGCGSASGARPAAYGRPSAGYGCSWPVAYCPVACCCPSPAGNWPVDHSDAGYSLQAPWAPGMRSSSSPRRGACVVPGTEPCCGTAPALPGKSSPGIWPVSVMRTPRPCAS